MITRRAFVSTFAGGLLAAPLTAEAQQTGTVHHTGYFSSSTSFTSAGAEGFRQGLRELGRVERQNIVIDYRSAEGQFDRLPDLAAELVRLKVDIIVTVATPAPAAAKSATGTIPIVAFGVGDPVGQGLITSLARPGGNLTELSFTVGVETFGKGLELVKESVLKLRRVAILSDPAMR